MPEPWEMDWSGAAGQGAAQPREPWEMNWGAQSAQSLPAQNAQPPQTWKHSLSQFWDEINPGNQIAAIARLMRPTPQAGEAMLRAQVEQWEKAKRAWKQGSYVEALGRGAAGALPAVGPAAAAIADKWAGTEPRLDKYGNVIEPGNAPDPMGALGSGLGFLTTTMLAPKAVKYTGKGAVRASRGFTRSALGLGGKMEAFGADPAGAVLRDTRGFRPSKIARTGEQRLGQLRAEQDRLVDNATMQPSLEPPVRALRSRQDAARAANSADTVAELQPMIDQLTEVRPGFGGNVVTRPGPVQRVPTGVLDAQGNPIMRTQTGPALTEIAPNQPARQYLDMQRAFNTDHVTNWNPSAQTRGKLGAARQAYHEMRQELDRAVPGVAEVNERMHSLIPAVERASQVSHNAGVLQNMLSRASKHTGALASTLFGLEHGGAVGGAAGLGLPEIISMPAGKMFAARGMNNAGRALKSWPVQRAAQLLPILGLLNDQYGTPQEEEYF